MKTRFGRPLLAVTLVEILIAVGVLGLLILTVILGRRSYGLDREQPRLSCLNRLRALGLAMAQWSYDHNQQLPWQVSPANGGTAELPPGHGVFPHFAVMSNELNTPKNLWCPADGQRRPATNFDGDLSDAQISYFVNLDVTTASSNMTAAGDRNLRVAGAAVTSGLVILHTNVTVEWNSELHSRSESRPCGNMLLSGGAAMQARTVWQTQEPVIRVYGSESNRLIFP